MSQVINDSSYGEEMKEGFSSIEHHHEGSFEERNYAEDADESSNPMDT